MEGLSALFQNFAELFTPFVNFLIWAWPIKISHLNDGEKGVILSFGKVRRKHAQKGPGLIFYFSFEEFQYCQAINCNVDFPEQTIITKDGIVSNINASIVYEILDVKKAVIETEGVEDLLTGICQNSIREHSSKRSLEDMKDAKKLTDSLASKINKKVGKYGVEVVELFLADLRPHDMAMLCEAARDIFKKT